MNDKPLTFIIFGATGDLAKRKLIPSLLDLYQKKLLGENFSVVGFSRKDLSDDDYREFAKNIIEVGSEKYSNEIISNFLNNLYYCPGDINDIETYHLLDKKLSNLDNSKHLCSNKLYYLAVPPKLYEPVFNNLAESGLTMPCKEHQEETWSRVLVEKPFGSNGEEAKRLDKILGKLFDEEQIFRIDHYLAKEAIQNILTFRFANAIFEPIWNKDNIEKVEINLYESGDVSERVSLYDELGALNDVGQNHILQMLALVGMEDPKGFTPELIRKARNEVLSKVVPFDRKIENYASRFQYEGYENEEGVSPKTKTETYFKLKLEINNRRWKGVPFYLESGKALKESKTEINLWFKDKESSVCIDAETCNYNNLLRFEIQPEEKIEILFWSKKPGLSLGLEKKILSFEYDGENKMITDAYQKVLYDCIRGDHTLFNSTSEVMNEWRIISDISEKWKNIPLKKYSKGSDPKDLKNVF